MEYSTIIIILAIILFLLIMLNHVFVFTPPPVGGCAGTMYGCCPDNMTAKIDAQGSNCVVQK
jgi:hypothetical protein